ncbi:MAG: proprotein convertase P-domain-containing protein [Phycisphaerae bacterium]
MFLGSRCRQMRGLAVALSSVALPLSAWASSPPPPPGCPIMAGSFPNPNPQLIPTGPAVIVSQTFVAGMDPYLWDVDVLTFISHTASADLDITIQSPAGTVVTLTTDNGGTLDNLFRGTLWDDDANPGGLVPYTTNNGLVNDHAHVNLAVSTPLAVEDALAVFIGENPNGLWTLTISDDLALNAGSLDGWQLDITALRQAPDYFATATFSNNIPIIIPTTPPPNVFSSQIVVGGMIPPFICDVNVRTLIEHSFAGDLDITLTSPGGTTVTLTTDNGGVNDNVFLGTFWDDSSNPGGQVPYVSNPFLATDHPYANLVLASPLVPEEPFGAFIGENPNGVWTLTISDDANLDGGILHAWDLIITVCACGQPNPPRRDFLYTGQPTFLDIGLGGSYPPIPNDFFDPGSDPFVGQVTLEGRPIDPATIGNTDTIVRRGSDPILLSDPIGAGNSVPIELVQLSLVSIQPITVTYNNGNLPQQWNVTIVESPSTPQPAGTLNAQKTHANGGVFNAQLPVIPALIFTEVGNPVNQRFLDTGGIFPPLQFNTLNAPWVHIATPPLEVVTDPGTEFIPAADELVSGDPTSRVRVPVTFDSPPDARHTICPAFPIGACCTIDGCVITVEPQCVLIGGVWQGAGVSCVDANCPVAPRCIYRVTCLSGPDCANCPLPLGSAVVGPLCGPNDPPCPFVITQTCALTGCCVEYTLVDCRPPLPGEPPIPPGLPCTCANTQACCLPGGGCIDIDPGLCVQQLCGVPAGPGSSCSTTICPVCPGDVNGDGLVNLTDLSMLLAAFGSCRPDPAYNCRADFNNDNCVTLTDLSVLLANFGVVCN